MQWQMLQYYINNRFKRGNKMKLLEMTFKSTACRHEEELI